jgi:hypothetical protein
MTKCRVVLILTLLFVVTGAAGGQTKWKTVESFRFDWDGHVDVHVTLELPTNWDEGGEFSRVRIQVPGQKEFILKDDVGWAHFRSEDATLPHDFAKTAKNLVSSKNVLAVRVSESRAALLLFGIAYGSSPGRLDVIEIGSDGQPRVVLHKNELGVKDIRDLDGNGVAEVVGYPCLSQGFGNDLLTYDPYNIYKFGDAAGTPVTLSLPLSKTYNLKHYYGWAGSQCSEDFAVVLHPPGGGKPRVMKTKDAEKLTGDDKR